MKTLLMLTLTLSCAVGARAENEEEVLFQKCLMEEGAGYLAMVDRLLGQPDALNWVSNRMVRAEVQNEQRMAAILFYRKTFPGTFEECRKVVAETRATPGMVNKQGLMFLQGTPLDMFVDMKGVIITKKNLTAQNAATQLSLIEYYMKFGNDFNDYERAKMLECLGRIDGGIFFKHEGYPGIPINLKDVYRKEMDDESRSLTIRIKAQIRLRQEVDRQKAISLRLAVFTEPAMEGKENEFRREDDPVKFDTVSRACEFFETRGTADDLAKLKTVTLPPDDWRSKFLHDTIQKLGDALEKEHTGEKDPGTLRGSW